MRKLLFTITFVPAAIVATALPGWAAEPTEPSCFGEDMSVYAREGFSVFGQPVEPGDGFGQFHYWFAQEVFHGMGEPVQLHQSGSVPAGALSVYSCGAE